MSACPRLTTPIQPCFNLTAWPSSTSRASVPGSMMSSFVSTPAHVQWTAQQRNLKGSMPPSALQAGSPMVRSPAGSTSLARWRASEVARSAFAGVTARMMALSPCAEAATMRQHLQV